MEAAAQNADGIRILVVVAAIAIATFWRPVLRLVLILLLTTIIAVIGFGAIAIWQDMHHMA
jgi:hypothetical protein